MPPVEFGRFAQREYQRAWRRYARHAPQTAARFALAVDAAVARIAFAPMACPPLDRGTRWCPVRKFAYHLVFVVLPTEVEVIAVAHNKQRPGYWSRRLGRP